MSDIVKELRDLASIDNCQASIKAADEIERLRAAVQDLAKHVWRGDWGKLHSDTRALVGEKE